jgi:hypothetical protein
LLARAPYKLLLSLSLRLERWQTSYQTYHRCGMPHVLIRTLWSAHSSPSGTPIRVFWLFAKKPCRSCIVLFDEAHGLLKTALPKPVFIVSAGGLDTQIYVGGLP